LTGHQIVEYLNNILAKIEAKQQRLRGKRSCEPRTASSPNARRTICSSPKPAGSMTPRSRRGALYGINAPDGDRAAEKAGLTVTEPKPHALRPV